MPKKVLLAPPGDVMARCDGLVKIYGKKGAEVMALQGLDLTVKRGELIGIIGSSGSGKSTLLNMLGGLDKPTAGSMFIDGRDMLKLSEAELTRYKRETVGFVWQNGARNLIPYLTALQNVELPMIISGYRERGKRAEELLAMLGLSERKNSLPPQMSGGEQQRAAIAAAMSVNPKMLLADEPTGSVDAKTAANILEAFRRVNRETGVTVIIVTHDTNLSKAIDRVVAIRDGKSSSEFIRRTADNAGFSEAETEHEELAVLDRAGRLQIPKEYLASLGIKGGDKVKVELEGEKIVILKKGENYR